MIFLWKRGPVFSGEPAVNLPVVKSPQLHCLIYFRHSWHGVPSHVTPFNNDRLGAYAHLSISRQTQMMSGGERGCAHSHRCGIEQNWEDVGVCEPGHVNLIWIVVLFVLIIPWYWIIGWPFATQRWYFVRTFSIHVFLFGQESKVTIKDASNICSIFDGWNPVAVEMENKKLLWIRYSCTISISPLPDEQGSKRLVGGFDIGGCTTQLYRNYDKPS